MPKISAPTVKEHRANVQSRLVEVAERILREEGPTGLTAGAVAAGAGIARNSIYRYIDSVDDLRGLVLAKYLPQWQAGVDEQVRKASGPEGQILAWVQANLEQAAGTGHGWLMAVAGGIRLPEQARRAVAQVHDHHGDDVLHAGLRELVAADQVDLAAELIRGLVECGFREIDAGRDAQQVIATVVRVVHACLKELTGV